MPVPAAPDFDDDADTLDRAGYRVVFEEDFTAPTLAADRWVAHYLPHWSTPERSAARYALDAGVLTLRIEADQPPWLPEEELRVSNIQTGSFSGPVGSDRGTHRHRPGLARQDGPAHPAPVHPIDRGGGGEVAGDRGPDVHARGLAGGVRGGCS